MMMSGEKFHVPSVLSDFSVPSVLSDFSVPSFRFIKEASFDILFSKLMYFADLGYSILDWSIKVNKLISIYRVILVHDSQFSFYAKTKSISTYDIKYLLPLVPQEESGYNKNDYDFLSA